MTKHVDAMHSECYAEAIRKGPRVVNVNGSDRVAYYLSRAELKKVFTKAGFNTRTGVSWLNKILDFKETWDELAPSEAVILDPREDWNMIFIHPNKSEYTALQMHAEDCGIPSLAVAE